MEQMDNRCANREVLSDTPDIPQGYIRTILGLKIQTSFPSLFHSSI